MEAEQSSQSRSPRFIFLLSGFIPKYVKVAGGFLFPFQCRLFFLFGALLRSIIVAAVSVRGIVSGVALKKSIWCANHAMVMYFGLLTGDHWCFAFCVAQVL
ncbi:hypothetical protein [Pseudodesulfovibrio senegalensis]|jgi:hypothetical protein|uniref:hypothetical protein n=1 Tax=Pseudodesulfovibrio senegalensis TaxID=1721087 RepID=UPI001375C255|nr:hypothetical protein [Pseudodesulfovibrio senegalensis]